MSHFQTLRLLPVFVALGCFAGEVDASVSVEMRPAVGAVDPGEGVSMGIYLVSETGAEIAVAAAEVVFTWDPAVLQLNGIGAGGSPLLQSTFPNVLDGGLNESNPPSDGDGFYLAFANLGSPVIATEDGYLLASLEFTAIGVSPSTLVTPEESGGSPAVLTRVFDGVTPNTIITGELISGSVSVGDVSPCPPTCMGDVDNNNSVNFDDINLVLSNWGSMGNPCDPGDANGDGIVNFDDLNEVLTNWGASCP